MKKNIYYAGFVVNFGQIYANATPCGSNLRTAIKDIREMAEGQVNGQINCRWYVSDERGNIVANGGRLNGIRFRNI